MRDWCKCYGALTSSGRQSETDSDSADGPSVNTKSVIRSSRKTATKAVDRVKELADAAGVPLPETPVAYVFPSVSQLLSQSLVAARSLVDRCKYKDVGGGRLQLCYKGWVRWSGAKRAARDRAVRELTITGRECRK